ncbi:MAG: BrnT family toxin [Candidatus Eisenbacteria bacterium]|nr:BrnT family toxin [Candidatus Eisenbacteria bacterium]
MDLRFEWDSRKANSNLKRHGVSFSEASTVLGDPLSITIPDPLHSHDEPRFLDLGMSHSGRLIVVVYTERAGTLRLISARPATRHEKQDYEEKGC